MVNVTMCKWSAVLQSRMTVYDARDVPEGDGGLLETHQQPGQANLHASTLGLAEALHEVGLLPAERLAFVSKLLKPKGS